ncbi:hypothetical protein ThvES_00019500 [Thiovulum sp. ES]|nr:hypothetical protein ThvES_00019500 [Thiovulum sp. ES]
MFKLGAKSQKHYLTLHKDLRTILLDVLKVYDISVIEGLRIQERQQQLFSEGKSKLDGVTKKSKHQASYCSLDSVGLTPDGKPLLDEKGYYICSKAADIIPYSKGTNPFSGNETDNRRFYTMMGIVQAVTSSLLSQGKIEHTVRFGLDWNGNQRYDDQTFHDLPHMELVEI